MNDHDEQPSVTHPGSIDIPYGELSEEALQGVIESFVLREGTDYGEREVPLEQKMSQVLLQLERGEARIIFDIESQSIDIVKASRPEARRPA
ncbi:MAG TPA: YheU family protein [Steroidobacteraceae bacterium]|nr:YheU family protein [Steroidobacteraceae bacterium]